MTINEAKDIIASKYGFGGWETLSQNFFLSWKILDERNEMSREKRHEFLRVENEAMNLYASQFSEEAEKLKAFKEYVHDRLDKMNIPTHPEGEHSKAGCRIGDRLDIIESKFSESSKSLDRDGLLRAIKKAYFDGAEFRDDIGYRPDAENWDAYVIQNKLLSLPLKEDKLQELKEWVEKEKYNSNGTYLAALVSFQNKISSLQS